MSDLIGSTEAARIAGITPSGFRMLYSNTLRGKTKTPVPEPVVQGARGSATYWKRSDIEAWAAARDRATGRPKPATGDSE